MIAQRIRGLGGVHRNRGIGLRRGDGLIEPRQILEVDLVDAQNVVAVVAILEGMRILGDVAELGDGFESTQQQVAASVQIYLDGRLRAV